MGDMRATTEGLVLSPVEALRAIVRRHDETMEHMNHARAATGGDNFVGGYFKGLGFAAEIARRSLLAELRIRAKVRGVDYGRRPEDGRWHWRFAGGLWRGPYADEMGVLDSAVGGDDNG